MLQNLENTANLSYSLYDFKVYMYKLIIITKYRCVEKNRICMCVRTRRNKKISVYTFSI